MAEKQQVLLNVLKVTIYYFLVAICSNFILRSIYLYKVFPEVMYLFWILFISLGSTMHFVNNQIQRLISVSVPFLLNLIFIVYALSVSGDFPHLLSDGELYSWNYLHYLNLHFLLSPILMLKSMYYFRYLVILITPSILLYLGMSLSNILKCRYQDKINSISFKKMDD